MNHSKINKTDTTKKTTKALWLSDLHLEKTTLKTLPPILKKIKNTSSDIVIITGDISTAEYLSNHLIAIATAAAPRPVYTVTGNHDYYSSSLADVDADVKETCSYTPNLHFLDGDEVIKLNNNTCLIGHRGWADARAGYGLNTVIKHQDSPIKDFDDLSHEQTLIKMRELGKESTKAIKQILPLALSQYEHVVAITHFPPYYQTVRFNGEVISPLHQPHYVNQSLGLLIWGIAKQFLHRNITVLAGHSHSGIHSEISSNISARVADAGPGRPAFELLNL